MIVWLASYPRSGNTLLRTLLNQHFALKTFDDEAVESQPTGWGWSETAKGMIGYEQKPCEWRDFYLYARSSASLTLIKTHQAPIDGNKAIYVIRDGRSAYVSYAKYHASYIRSDPQSLLGLVLGMDFYGGWTDHYLSWTRASNPLLILRYEHLVSPDQSCLARISEFLNCAQPAGEWRNPFDDLHRQYPDFFREGRDTWQKPAEWSELINSVFFAMHGGLMAKLGYADRAEIDLAIDRMPREMSEFLDIHRKLVHGLAEHRRIAQERQAVIDQLKQACDERLALIEALSRNASAPEASIPVRE